MQSLRPGRVTKVPERGANYDHDPRAPRKDAENTKGPHDDVVGDALVLLHDDVRTASAESTVMETAVFEGVVSGVVNWSRARKASGWKAVAVAGVVLEALVFYVKTNASLYTRQRAGFGEFVSQALMLSAPTKQQYYIMNSE